MPLFLKRVPTMRWLAISAKKVPAALPGVSVYGIFKSLFSGGRSIG